MSIYINGYSGRVTSKVNGWKDYEEGHVYVEGRKYDVLVRNIRGARVPLVCAKSGAFLTSDDLQVWKDGDFLYVRKSDKKVLSSFVAYSDYSQCECCNLWVPVSRIKRTEDCKRFCEDCFDKCTIVCDFCGGYYSASHIHHKGLSGEDDCGQYVTFCRACASHFTTCTECGCIVHEDDVIYLEGNRYCNNCYRDLGLDLSDIINEYHCCGKESDYGFKWKHKESRRKNPILGTELEVIAREDRVRESAEATIATLGEDVILCKDGSLGDNGFEIVSCPADLWNIRRVMKWKEAMDELTSRGTTSHDNGRCGHHVHIDREYFIGSNLTSEEIEAAFLTVITNNANWIKNFSRRETWVYCEMNHENGSDTVPYKNYKIKDTEGILDLWTKKLTKTRSDRYQAVNLTRSDTIELRFFRGTLNYETFIANEQFADMIARMIKACNTLEDACKIDLMSFRLMAVDREYTEFLNYLDRRGIVDGTEEVYEEDNATGF